MMTPANIKHIDEAKENRLSYLASIPIVDFNDELDIDDENEDNINKKQQPKSKHIHSVRFKLSSSQQQQQQQPTPPPVSPRSIQKPKQQLLTKDFLHNFPLLRALVEEALALQEHPHDIPIPIRRFIFDERSHSAGQQGQRQLKPSPTRPKSATNIRSIRTKSVIVPKKIHDTRRLYPPSPDTRHMIVTKNEVRNLVDRLSKPKYNKRLEQQIAFAEQITTNQEPVITPRLPPKSTSVPVGSIFFCLFSYLNFSTLIENQY